jgi:polyisoprenoid-binding protein YceI
MNMKTILTVLAALTLAGTAGAADNYMLDSDHTSVGFSVKHLMVSKVSGSFAEVSGSLVYDAEEPAASSVEVTIKTASIDTNNDDRDAHLRSWDFFYAEKYPEITFESTSVATEGDAWVVTGKLTMHGTSRLVSIPFTVNGPVIDPWGKTRMGIEAETITLDRKDFGLTWNKALETGGVAVGDEVKISIDFEAVRTEAAATEPE